MPPLPLGLTTDDVLRVLLLRDYGVRVTAIGVMLLGLAGGVVGTFLLLRRRALVGDALAHATFPGVCVGFMLSAWLTGRGKSMPWLLTGAAAAGAAGAVCVVLIRRHTRLKEDTTLAIVLGCFFGLGVVLTDVATGGFGETAGIKTFIEGNPAALLRGDAWLIGGILLASLIVCGLLYKELRLLCFDSQYAASQGWPVVVLDLGLMALVTLVVVGGLQAVGLILVIAVLIIPAAAARFWTHRLGTMCLIAGLVGAGGGLVGAWGSALMGNWPAGATIVLAMSAAFAVSMATGPAGGLLPDVARRRVLGRRVASDNLLRAVYEAGGGDRPVATADLLRRRSWKPAQLRRHLARARSLGLVGSDGDGHRLTESGVAGARRVVRNHRLWEHYMMTRVDVAADHVDRNADLIEHVLGDELVARLEAETYGRP